MKLERGSRRRPHSPCYGFRIFGTEHVAWGVRRLDEAGLKGTPTNIDAYPAYRAYLRMSKPPLVAIWERNDPFFRPPGAEAFKRDVPGADVRLIDTGHFALETNLDDIVRAVASIRLKA